MLRCAWFLIHMKLIRDLFGLACKNTLHLIILLNKGNGFSLKKK